MLRPALARKIRRLLAPNRYICGRMPKRKSSRIEETRKREMARATALKKPRMKKKKTPTAILELKGRAGYRPGQANKSAPRAEVLEETHDIPKRNKHGELVFKDYPDFRPNLTPSQVLQLGSFGGTYFRPITSAVTGESYKKVYKEFPVEWFKGLEKKHVSSKIYDMNINRYKVKCGGSLDMWESSGWISDIDPYGWFQWYCRFYLGRRSSDDYRQVKRALGVMSKKGRFRNQLIKKCAMAGTTYDDYSISPVIRQSLQHWGYELTERDADAYVKLKKLPKLAKRGGT